MMLQNGSMSCQMRKLHIVSPCNTASHSICQHRRQQQHRRVCKAVVQGHAIQAPVQQASVVVPPHPLVKHWLSVARNASTSSPTFRSCMVELGRLLIYEAVRDVMPTKNVVINTPISPAECTVVDDSRPIKVVPILRAGLVLLEAAAQVLPAHETYHVGYVRDEKTLVARPYLNKLPHTLHPDDLILISDPMLATGGTIVQVVEDIIARGAKAENIRVVSVVAAPPALAKLAQYRGLLVFTASVDPKLNERGYIVPGLGDAGDRAFGTVN